MNDQNDRVLDQFGQQAGAYAALVNAGAGARRDPLIDLIAPRPAYRVLDVGCGSGQFAVAIAPMVASVVGIDLTPAMLDRARAHQADKGVINVCWQEADAASLPFDDGAFDVVVSRSTFHHAAAPAGVLAEMRRVCAIDGRIFVSDLTPAAAKGPAFDAIELLRDPSHNHALTVDELRKLGADLGLTELVIQSRLSAVPLEAVLATSFPPAGMIDHIRALFARDAALGEDIFGMRPEIRGGAIWLSYPMTELGWHRD